MWVLFFIFFRWCFSPHIGHLCLSGCDGELEGKRRAEGEKMGGRDLLDKLWLLSRKPPAALVLPFLTCKGIVIFSVERFFLFKVHE